MKTTPDIIIHKTWTIAMVAMVALALGIGSAHAYERIFDLTLTNGLNVPVTWTIKPGNCYEGTGVGYPGGLVHGPVAPGASVVLKLARVQGNDCDGEQGKFAIASSFAAPGIPEGSQGWSWQHFDFSNDGELRETYYPDGYSSVFSSNVVGNQKDYFWTMKDVSHRLSGPLDERLTMPRNQVARNFGKWDGGSEDGGGIVADRLTFRKNGFEGMTYNECFFHPLFHAQHIVRLPNKNGQAYIAVSNSWAEVPDFLFIPARPRGSLVIYRSDSLDPVTDLVPNNPGTDGEIVWEQIYGWNVDQAVPYNPIGSWNHPCKMDVIGGVLIVSMQDWDASDDGVFGYACRDGTKIGDQDSLVFDHVRDPENPRYWGRMTKQQLGVKKIEDAAIVQVGRWWVLYVKGKWWVSQHVSPILTDWWYGGTGNPPGNLQGQYFNSYERYDLPGETTPVGTVDSGTERVIFGNGDGTDASNKVAGNEYLSFAQMEFDADEAAGGFSPKVFGESTYRNQTAAFRAGPNLWTIDQGGLGELVTHKKDYDACGVSVRKGMPVFYSPLVWYNDGGGDFDDETIDYIWQVYHPDNFALQTPPEPRQATNGYDNETGSLREAIGHGGTITFAPDSGDLVIGLRGGPLVVYLHGVAIDASSYPNGCTLLGWPDSYGKIAPLIQIAPGLNFSMKNVRSLNDPLAAALSTTHLACATGGYANWFAQSSVLHSAALATRSGDITDDQESYLHSAVEGPGTLSFWWKVSSEQGRDFLRFRLDGFEQPAAPGISGESGWQQKTISIPAGHRQLRWTYSKDVDTSAGLDAAFLSEVVYTPAPPVITTPLTMNGTQGVWSNANYIIASGSPTSFTATGLPAGLYLRSDKGEIYGSPAVSGVFNVTVTATNAGGTSTPAAMTITIAPTATTLVQALDLPVQAIPIEHYGVSVPFFGQTSVTHDGTDAAQSAAIGDDSTSDFVTYVYGPGTLSFWWKVSSESGSDFLRLHVADQELPGVPGISGNVDWQFVSITLPASANAVRFFYSKNSSGSAGSDAGWVDQVVFVPSLAQALDTPPIPWTTYGNANWAGQMATTLDTVAPVPSEFSQRDAAQCGDIGDNQVSSLETTVTGPATLTFWWKVSSETNFDFLRFYLDGIQQAGALQISGDVDWQQKTIPIPAGSHALRWTYSKDGSLDGGDDAGWVDLVLLSPPHTITSALTASGTQGAPFSYQVTARHSPTILGAGTLPPGLTINTQTGLISGTPTAAGVYNVDLTARDILSSWWGSSTDTLVLTLAPSAFSAATALDTSGMTWTTSAPGAWYGQTTTTQDGIDAMRSSGIGDGQSAALETTITGPGLLSFWWKVSSEANFGLLAFAMDGAPVEGVQPISGEIGWVKKFVLVPPGEHKFSWAYHKQGYGLVGADAGWVDQVQFISGLVTTLADSGPGSLRQVLLDLPNLVGQTPVVNFHDTLNGGTISLGGTEISFLKNVSIDGSSLTDGITITGAGLSRVFKVTSGRTVAMTGITITGGNASFGGGIWNDGSLTLNKVRIAGNSGGGIFNDQYQALTINNSTITGNTVASNGGGVVNAGTLVVENSTFDGNSANSGGAIHIVSDGTTTLTNCTITNNSASSGGGISQSSSLSTHLLHCTVSGNQATGVGGGINLGSGTLGLENCIVAGNTAVSSGADINKSGGTITTAGRNLIGNNSSVTAEFPAGPLVGTSVSPLPANLATLGDYGGVTDTMPPLPGSPAFDAAIASTTPLSEDQRGMEREFGDAPDLGAVEIATFVGVASSADTGANTLRKAVASADFLSTIIFDPALAGATLALSSELLVDKGVTIDAVGVAGLTLSGNNATRIFNVAPEGTLTLRDLTLANGFIGAAGGAISNSGITSIENCTLTGNAVNDNWGGAIFNDNVLNLTNTTFTGNSTGIGSGGAVFNANGILMVQHCTFSGNTATNGGGIYNYGSGQVGLSNSIVAGNSASSGPDILWNGGPITTEGVNLIGNTANSGISPGATVLTGDPRLAPPGAYGGPTPTMPPLPGSRAIEGAAPLAGTPPSDQRGNPRPSGPLPDLGAVEAGPFPLGSLSDTDNDGIPDILEGPTGPYPQFTVGIDDRALDSDGDGSTDAAELANMTNPNDPNDFMRSLSFGTAPGFDPVSNLAFMASFATFPGLSYDLESSSNLMDFAPIPGSGFTAEDFSSTFEIQLAPGHGFVRMRRK